ncbi:MAG: hypothetical protein COU85_00825 [Candidatus Portnoybacteria bacterium CG10_big_fil_rev_8_21_14_0_10_44_7]|uniref:Translation initiation factor IF-2 n=1 Tax=Candidatus Portnoybacteria bacterium CG10_big_fil_rev_8_21_14_0_10_44_7 TaxID=1974816 RepID=A0A2M8KJ67_9BACT|nr:MAG: hypothetical protein COU85_00825 [Candidatus Portnoybacteria bacterium CG10_big_fil_rev_8_21_14_0_10_44_7]
MSDWQKKPQKTAPASTPIQLLGLDQVPFVGETFKVKNTLEEAKDSAQTKKAIEQQKRRHQEIISPRDGQKILNIILKADTIGTLEAVRQALEAIDQEKVMLRILDADVGHLTENDLKLAVSARAEIFGFKIKTANQLLNIARREKVKIRVSDIIYELIQAVRESMVGLLDPQINKKSLGRLEILAVFKNTGDKRIVGGRVVEGLIQNGARFDISRAGEYIGPGQINQLQQNKQDTKEVGRGKECGLAVKSAAEIQLGDILEVYQEEKKQQTL